MPRKISKGVIMSEINDLAYFLNSIKDTLPCNNEKELEEKINHDKDFRIKVQKLVYLSKLFGWDNTYHFNFHKRGPYSIELSDDYRNIPTLKKDNDFNFKLDSFKEFIENGDTEYLEALSTIIYYCNKIKPIEIDNEIIAVLTYLKPNISKKVIESALKKINNFNLLNKLEVYDSKKTITDEIVLDKIKGLQDIFENFEECSNKTLILGSLDYLKIALKKEKLNVNEKTRFLCAIYSYVDEIEHYYFRNYKLSKSFSNYDLSAIDESFIKLQQFISDLNVIPRLYDEDIDLNVFYK